MAAQITAKVVQTSIPICSKQIIWIQPYKCNNHLIEVRCCNTAHLILFTVADKESIHWYVLRAVFRSELKVRDALRHSGFHCYVPMKYGIETQRGHKVRRLAPAITELVFVQATSSAINDFKLRSKETVYWLTRPSGKGREKITIPDKQMDDFIRITQQNEHAVTYFRPEEINLHKGDHIFIHGGPFDGVEGILLKIKGKRDKQLLVSIPDIVSAAITIQPDMVQLVSKKTVKSTNASRDSKELIRLTHQMLMSPPDMVSQEHEYNMLLNEISRLYNSLQGLKGYLPSLEGQISISLLMAERVLGTTNETTRQRCNAAISHLRPSKLRDQLYNELGKLE